MQDLHEIRRLLDARNFSTAHAELDDLRRRRLEQNLPIDDIERIQEEIETARQGYIDQQIAEANKCAAGNQWERVLAIVDAIFELDYDEERALNLRQQANDALRKLAEARSLDETMTEARRRVNGIRSRQDALLAINFIEAKIGATPNDALSKLLEQARNREREIRERENIMSTLEMRNDMVGLLQKLEEEYQKGSITVTINGQVRELVSYLPQMRATVRTAMEERANEYMQRARDLCDVSPHKALDGLKEARAFPELTRAKLEQIDEQISLVGERVRHWDEARKLMTEANKLSVSAPAEALTRLNQARSLAPNLPNLIDELLRLRQQVISAHLQRLHRLFDEYRLQVESIRDQSNYDQAERLWQEIADLYDGIGVIWSAIRAEEPGQSSALLQNISGRMEEMEAEYVRVRDVRRNVRQTLDTLIQVRASIEGGDLAAADQGLETARGAQVLGRAIGEVENLLAARKGAAETERMAIQRKDEGDFAEARKLAEQLPASRREAVLRAINSARAFAEAEAALNLGDLSTAQRKYNEVLRFKGDEQSRARERLTQIQDERKADQEIETRLKNARLSIEGRRYKEGIEALAGLLKQPSSFYSEIHDTYRKALQEWRAVLLDFVQTAIDKPTLINLKQGFDAATSLHDYQLITGPDDRHVVNRVQQLYYTQQAEEAEQRAEWIRAKEMWTQVVSFDAQAATRAQRADQHSMVAEALRERDPITALTKKLDDPLYRRSPVVLKAMINLCMAERRLTEAQEYVDQLRQIGGDPGECDEFEQRISHERIYQAELAEIERRYGEHRYYEAVTMLGKLIENYPDRRLRLQSQLVEWRNHAITELEKVIQTGSALNRYLACQQIEQFGHDSIELRQRKTKLASEARAELEDLLQRAVRQLNLLGTVELRDTHQQLSDSRLAFDSDRDLTARVEEALRLVVQRLNDHNTMERLLGEVNRLMGQACLEEADAVMKSKVEERYGGRHAVAHLRQELNSLLLRQKEQRELIDALRRAFQQEHFEAAIRTLDKLRSYIQLLLSKEELFGILPWRDPKTHDSLATLPELERHWQVKLEHHSIAVDAYERVAAQIERLRQRCTSFEAMLSSPSAPIKAQLLDLQREIHSSQDRWKQELNNLPESKSSLTDSVHSKFEDLLDDKLTDLGAKVEDLIKHMSDRDQRIGYLDVEIENRINSGLFDEHTRKLIDEALSLDNNRQSFQWYNQVFNQNTDRNEPRRRRFWPFT